MPCIEKTQAAQEDLINIWRYTFKNWGEGQADAYLDDIEKTFALLAHSPLLGRKREEFTPSVRTHTHKQHLIIYVQIHQGIRLIRILHKSMDVDSQIEDET